MCPYGDKCQYAHGTQELRMNSLQNFGINNAMNNKQQNNYLNYKIIKCKNWEKDRTCKYGAHCTFAHGDNDLRNKADNLYQINNSFPMVMPMVVPPGMDVNQMQQIMLNNQLMMNMNPGFQNGNNMPQNKNDTNNEQ